jgi:thiamine biosynthesis lipoprotein
MKKAVVIFLSFAIFLSVAGCNTKSKAEKFTDYSFDYFDTVTTIVGYAQSKEEFDNVCSSLKTKLGRYHKLFDIYNTYDEFVNLADINKLYDGKHKEQKVDKEIIDLILFSKEMYTLTKGKTNIAMGSVLSIWHQYRTDGKENPQNAKLPPLEELKAAAEHININDVVVNKEKSTVFLADDKMRLDVGAIAKGYVTEKLYDFLKEKNISGYVINLGGNIKTLGTHPNGELFSVGIENPDTKDEKNPFIETLNVKDMSVVTSGNYQRYYTVYGKNYHHIINPKTLMPSENFSMVSVVCENSGYADALSTALFSMDLEEGKALVNSLPNTQAMWVELSGKVHKTEGFK